MIQAKDLNFDLNDSEIMFTRAQKPGQEIKMTVEDGNRVSLKRGNIEIEVHSIKRNEDGTYCGVVQYVEPHQELSKEGVEEGVDISFSYGHIFAC